MIQNSPGRQAHNIDAVDQYFPRFSLSESCQGLYQFVLSIPVNSGNAQNFSSPDSQIQSSDCGDFSIV
jgi:hypothetical protein